MQWVIKIYYTMELDQSVPSSFNILMLTSSTGKSGLEINVFSQGWDIISCCSICAAIAMAKQTEVVVPF